MMNDKINQLLVQDFVLSIKTDITAMVRVSVAVSKVGQHAYSGAKRNCITKKDTRRDTNLVL